MKLKLKRIAPLQAGKILAVLYGAMSVLIVPFFVLFSTFAAVASGGRGAAMPMMFGLGFLVIAPILYAAMGFVGGVVGSWLYNLIAGWVGGFELEFEQEQTREYFSNVPPPPPLTN